MLEFDKNKNHMHAVEEFVKGLDSIQIDLNVNDYNNVPELGVELDLYFDSVMKDDREKTTMDEVKAEHTKLKKWMDEHIKK